MGFQDIYNENNTNFWGSDPDETNLFEYVYVPSNNLQIDFNQLRIFIPTGTKELEVIVNVSTNIQRIGYVARFKKSPNTNLLHQSFSNIPWYTKATSVERLGELEFGELYIQGIKNKISIIPYTVFDKPLHDSFTGWLYLKAMRFDLGNIINLTTKIKVDKAFYNDWLNRVVLDDNNNPLFSYPPVGFTDNVQQFNATTLLIDDLYPNSLSNTINGFKVQRFYYVSTAQFLKVKISILSKTLGSSYHLNISTTRFLTDLETQAIQIKSATESLGELDPGAIFPDGVINGDRIYITIINLLNIKAEYDLYVELV